MQLEKFIYGFHKVIGSQEDENEFAAMRIVCCGLAGAKLGKLLNYASNFLEKGEVYLEIGTYTGYSLIAASFFHIENMFIGIDNFQLVDEGKIENDLKDRIEKRLRVNLQHFHSGNQEFIKNDYSKVDLDEKMKIGVFLI